MTPPWWWLRGQKFLILITLDCWKRHFQEKNYIENYFYLLKSTKITKTASQKCWRNIIWVDFFGHLCHINGIKTRLGLLVIDGVELVEEDCLLLLGSFFHIDKIDLCFFFGSSAIFLSVENIRLWRISHRIVIWLHDFSRGEKQVKEAKLINLLF